MSDPTPPYETGAEAAQSHNILSEAAERETAISELRQQFTRLTTEPLEATVPDYDKEERFDGYSNPYLYRNEENDSWTLPGITFKVDSYPDRVSSAATRKEIALYNEDSTEATFIKQLTGREIVGAIEDYRPNTRDSSVEESNGQYLFTHDDEGTLDVLYIPANFISSNAEKTLFKEAARELRHPGTGAKWVTLELLKEAFGDKIQPAATNDVRRITAKLEQLVSEYPGRVARYKELSAADRAAYERSQTIRGKIGKLASRFLGSK